jgi:hypothetical protein
MNTVMEAGFREFDAMQRCLEGRIATASPRPGMACYRGRILDRENRQELGVLILLPGPPTYEASTTRALTCSA